MGANKKQSGNVDYYNIINGSISQKVKEGTEDAVSRVNKKGDTVWELQYNSLEGIVTKIEVEESKDFGRFIKVWMKDVDEVMMLNIPFESAYGYGLCYKMPFIDWTKPLELGAFMIYDEKRKKDVGRLKVYSDGS